MGPIRPNPCPVNWTVPLCDFTHPKTVIAIEGQSFKCLLDTGADRTVLKKEEVPSHWELVPGPHVSGVGGTSKAQETASYLPWVGPEGERGRIRPLVVQGLKDNLAGKDIMAQMDVVLTTDHNRFFEDLLESIPGPSDGVRKDLVKVYPQV